MEPFLRKMEEILSLIRQYSQEWTGTVLLHLFELRLPHSEYDLHNELDRTAEQGL